MGTQRFAKRLYILLFLAAALAAPANAQIISHRFDGVYAGSANPSPALSDPSCGAPPLNRLEIENGILRAWHDGRQTVKGFVTQSGFFNADYYFPGNRGVPFEGRIDAGGRLSGGIIDGGCAWVVDLKKSPPPQKTVS